MAAGDTMSSPHLVQSHDFAIGPSWVWLTLWLIVVAAMLPWILSPDPAEIPFPWLGTLILPEGMPLWAAVTAGICALICSMRCRVVIDERQRTITRWRCVGVLIPWSVKTRAFHEVRFVRTATHVTLWQHIVNPFLEVLAGDPAYDRNVTIPSAASFDVQIVFDDRDWFNAGRGPTRHMVALADELCRILEVRRG